MSIRSFGCDRVCWDLVVVYNLCSEFGKKVNLRAGLFQDGDLKELLCDGVCDGFRDTPTVGGWAPVKVQGDACTGGVSVFGVRIGKPWLVSVYFFILFYFILVVSLLPFHLSGKSR